MKLSLVQASLVGRYTLHCAPRTHFQHTILVVVPASTHIHLLARSVSSGKSAGIALPIVSELGIAVLELLVGTNLDLIVARSFETNLEPTEVGALQREHRLGQLEVLRTVGVILAHEVFLADFLVGTHIERHILVVFARTLDDTAATLRRTIQGVLALFAIPAIHLIARRTLHLTPSHFDLGGGEGLGLLDSGSLRQNLEGLLHLAGEISLEGDDGRVLTDLLVAARHLDGVVAVLLEFGVIVVVAAVIAALGLRDHINRRFLYLAVVLGMLDIAARYLLRTDREGLRQRTRVIVGIGSNCHRGRTSIDVVAVGHIIVPAVKRFPIYRDRYLRLKGSARVFEARLGKLNGTLADINWVVVPAVRERLRRKKADERRCTGRNE